jgi:ABC-type uncharacterized transport system permease subunit
MTPDRWKITRTVSAVLIAVGIVGAIVGAFASVLAGGLKCLATAHHCHVAVATGVAPGLTLATLAAFLAVFAHSQVREQLSTSRHAPLSPEPRVVSTHGGASHLRVVNDPCERCGEPNSESATFCRACGYSLAGPSPSF